MDITKSVEKVQRYISGMSKKTFLANELTVDGVARNLEIIGEAVLNIPTEVRDRYPEVDWKHFGKLRNFLAHGYFSVNSSMVWNIARNELLPFKEQVEHILELEKIPESTAVNLRARTIYPKQQETAAAIISIARSLLEAGSTGNAWGSKREISPGIIEVETSAYKVTQNNQTKILLITAKDSRQVLIKAKIEEERVTIDFASKIIPEDLNNWLQIKQNLDKKQTTNFSTEQLSPNRAGAEASPYTPKKEEKKLTSSPIDSIQRTKVFAIYSVAAKIFNFNRETQSAIFHKISPDIHVVDDIHYRLTLNRQPSSFTITAKDGRGELIKMEPESGKILYAANINDSDVELWQAKARQLDKISPQRQQPSKQQPSKQQPPEKRKQNRDSEWER